MTSAPPPDPWPPAPIESIDRIYASRFANERFGLLIHKVGQVADADGNNVFVDMLDERTGNYVFNNVAADHIDTGAYEVPLGSDALSTPGYFTLLWNYTLDGTQNYTYQYLEVGQVAPAYDALDGNMKDVIERVLQKFGDLFDSVEGGPNLLDYYQTKFGRNRLAQLMGHAMDGINMGMQPVTSYTLSNPGRFPLEQWPGLLEAGLYIEVLKHLRRSYVEQPVVDGIQHARFDRRDYMQRWGEILEEEKIDYTRALELFKFDNMAAAVVLVSGGAYGNFGVERLPLSAAARPNFWSRIY